MMTWKHDGKHPEPHDDELRRALADLPRERAGKGFTEQVLRRLDEVRDGAARPDRSARELFRHFRRQPALAGAAVGLLLVAVLLGIGVLRPARDDLGPQEPGPVVAQAGGPDDGSSTGSRPAPVEPPETPTKTAAAVRSDGPDAAALLQELRREHTRLKRDLRDLRELAEGSQVIYLGGDESLDFVLDLNRERPSEAGSGVRPAGLPRSGPGAQRFF